MGEILGIVASLVGPVLELGKCIVVPIKRQFDYLCCFNSHIKSLRDEVKKLEDARVELQKRVDETEGNGEQIVPQVKAWLTSADNEVQLSMTGIEIEIPKLQSGCSTIISRYSLSKKAKKTTDAMKELRDDCSKFNDISLPAPPAATVSIPLGQTHEFESRKQIEEGIMEALRSKKVNIIGICGMGGVGKTTMAKRIMNRVMKEHLFDEAVITVVGQQLDMLKIQSEISESLGLKLGVETLVPRAHELRGRLKGTKRSLIVVDDIWKKFDLEELGIPCKSVDESCCTVLLTSRDKDVLNEMKAQNVYAIQTLSESEAWFLFKEKSGICSADSNLRSLAQDITKECKGLPIALITIGTALKDKKLKPIWEDALQQLKDANPVDMPSVLEEVYKPLRLSFDLLRSKNAKSLFLLCCLFPEDSDISLKYLTLFCMGLRIFEGTRNLEQVRNKVFKVVDMLKSRFLLLDGSYRDAVRMHDVVRDIAIFISSKEGLVDINLGHKSYSECKWISFFPREGNELSKTLSLNFASLQILIMHCRSRQRLRMKDVSFLHGMKEINVLALQHVEFNSTLQTMQLLKNLRTLHLVSCYLENISVVGELFSLEILCCQYCQNIKELPIEIGRLNCLKSLEFSICQNLKTIPPGVLSNLVELEELTMVQSFMGWESAKEKKKESGNVNVSLHELQLLPKLMCLNIAIKDYTLAAGEIHFSSKLEKYHIGLGGLDFSFRKEGHYEKTMRLNLPRAITVENWVHTLARSTEELWLVGDGSNIWDLLHAPNVESLTFQDCSTAKNLLDTTPIDDNFTVSKKDSFHIFRELKYLWLRNLPNFEEICNGPIPRESKSFKNLQQINILLLPVLKHLWRNLNQDVSLSNLRKIEITDCGSLRNLFPLEMAMAHDDFLQLEELKIRSCAMMDEVFLIKEIEKHGEITSHLTFPQLKKLILWDLENLSTVSKRIESIEFPALTDMDIVNCPKLISLVSSSVENPQHSAKSQEDDCLHLLCKVKFGSLKTLQIGGYNNFNNIWCHQMPDSFFIGLQRLTIVECDSIKSLFSYAIVRNLVNLGYLNIERCKEMVKLIEDEEEMIRETHGPLLLFPSLQKLRLESLPKFRGFCEWRCDLELPVLGSLFIAGCLMMKDFSMGSLIGAPKLEFIQCSWLTSIVSPLGQDGHDDDTFHLFCGQKATFGMLKRIIFWKCNDISNLWCHQISNSFFTGLDRIDIDGCDSIRSLFSYGIVRNLVNLKALTIGDCKEMVKVIEDEEEIVKETDCPLLLFPNLKNLYLECLPKLGSFCEWRCDLEYIELPMLNHLSIVGCPMMKVFTMGSRIRTPKLVGIEMDDQKKDVGDLNELMKLHDHIEEEVVKVENV